MVFVGSTPEAVQVRASHQDTVLTCFRLPTHWQLSATDCALEPVCHRRFTVRDIQAEVTQAGALHPLDQPPQRSQLTRGATMSMVGCRPSAAHQQWCCCCTSVSNHQPLLAYIPTTVNTCSKIESYLACMPDNCKRYCITTKFISSA
jgi:hypothetical protein